MKRPLSWLFLYVLILILSSCNSKKQNSNEIKEDLKEETFFGLKPPGKTPELFAPGVVSTNNLEIEAAVSPSMDEFYYVRQKKGESPQSYVAKYVDGEWQETATARSDGEVFISLDNKTMYLGNKYRSRTDTGWTEEKSLGDPYAQYPVMRLTASAKETHVFDEREVIGVIRYTELVDGKRSEVKQYDENINRGKFTAHPFIAPDESYLIWDSERVGGYGGSDLYISFRQEDGSWGPAINMGGEINTELDDTYGSITSDGKYFFFYRIYLRGTFEESEANIYWVDAEVVMGLKKS